MMQVDLLAQIIAQHHFDLERSIEEPQYIYCECGKQFLFDSTYEQEQYDLHIAQAILDALQPASPPVEQSPGQVPLFDHEGGEHE